MSLRQSSALVFCDTLPIFFLLLFSYEGEEEEGGGGEEPNLLKHVYVKLRERREVKFGQFKFRVYYDGELLLHFFKAMEQKCACKPAA